VLERNRKSGAQQVASGTAASPETRG